MFWEEYGKARKATQLCRDGVRRTKVQLQLSLTRVTKNNKKGVYRYFIQKRQVKESVPPLMSKVDKLMRMEKVKAEVFNDVFGLSSLATFLPTSLEWMGYRDWRSKVPNYVSENQICDDLRNLNICKYM